MDSAPSLESETKTTTTPGQAPLPRLLRERDMLFLLGVSRATFYRWRRKGLAPPPLRVGRGYTRWDTTTVLAWLAARQDQPR